MAARGLSALSPGAQLALRLAFGALVLAMAAWAFGEIADEVHDGEALSDVDEPVTAWLLAHAWPPLTAAMLWLTHAHGIAAISLYSALFAAWLAFKRQFWWLLTLLLVVPGGMVVNALMKLAFARARPVLDEPVLELATYSFPSGHTASSTMFYGLLACYLLPLARTWRLRAVIVSVAATLVLLVAFSRVYLGVHYLTDVAAAAAEGVAWLALCISGVHALRVRVYRPGSP
jgi:undecaprenyl-diphosphatase